MSLRWRRDGYLPSRGNIRKSETALSICMEEGGHDMVVYLAGCFSRPYCVENWYKARGMLSDGEKTGEGKNMDLYLAGTTNGNMGRFIGKNLNALEAGKEKSEDGDTRVPRDKQHGVHILESFYYADEWTEKMIPVFGKFLLDSGAFTMMMNSSKAGGVNWDEYVDRYADFIVRNKVERFFELDIDKIIGYDRVIALRNRLEKKTGRQAIPVWHKYRGKDNFLRMCDEYKYVAIGGIVTKEIQPEEYKYFPWLISEAHRRGAKIHGLGFTAMKELPRCHFDSVDSTAWTTGNRFGMVYEFDGRSMVKHKKGKGQCLKDSRAVAIHNFNEWVKFQKWAETHL